MERIGRLLTAARYLILLGVIVCLALCLLLFILIVGRGVLAVEELVAAIGSEHVSRLLVVQCVELADFILLAVALYIMGIGLFELFIAPVRMPSWLMITSLDDLKSKLVNIVVVALGVSFLGQVVTWDGVTNLLPLGVAIGAVIVSLSVFGTLRFGKNRAVKPSPDEPDDERGSAAASEQAMIERRGETRLRDA